uniref:Photosystem I assembly related protein n=1 Tax=Palmaria palmata TaxID=2822 RepID=A0A1C9CHA0_PALPL|nr:hypothetical protein Palma_134 [Palmaria palmata]AOM67766.1 hypothetical protein Palma_134 [Palmaria palmata]
MIEIIPITYLILLSAILTPIFILLILQVINFQRKEYSLLKNLKSFNMSTLSTEEIYSIANLCIHHKKLCLALTVLEDRLHKNTEMSLTWQAKYCNAIGFIFNDISLYMTAKTYYEHACRLDPKYLYSRKNLENLYK